MHARWFRVGTLGTLANLVKELAPRSAPFNVSHNLLMPLLRQSSLVYPLFISQHTFLNPHQYVFFHSTTYFYSVIFVSELLFSKHGTNIPALVT